MRSEEYGVFVFFSTNWAIRAENLALKAGFEVKLIPTPRHLSSDCGTALRFWWTDLDSLTALLEGNSVSFDRVAKV